jgi:hypothetical protein
MKPDSQRRTVSNRDKIEKRFEKKDTPHPPETGAPFFMMGAGTPMLFLEFFGLQKFAVI